MVHIFGNLNILLIENQALNMKICLLVTKKYSVTLKERFILQNDEWSAFFGVECPSELRCCERIGRFRSARRVGWLRNLTLLQKFW